MNGICKKVLSFLGITDIVKINNFHYVTCDLKCHGFQIVKQELKRVLNRPIDCQICFEVTYMKLLDSIKQGTFKIFKFLLDENFLCILKIAH